MSEVPAHGSSKQNCCEFEANLAYRGIYLKTEGEEGGGTGEIASSVGNRV